MYIHFVTFNSKSEVRTPQTCILFSDIPRLMPTIHSVSTNQEDKTMKNIIILTHGEFSRGITQSCRMILGDVAAPLALSIRPDSSTDMVNSMLENAICAYPKNETVVLLTDIPGGSTTRSALSMLNTHSNLIVISGLNLGLLLEIAVLETAGDLMEDRAQIEEILAEARSSLQIVGDSAGASSDSCEHTESPDSDDSGEL